jgi:hypothetical protein
MLATHSYDSPAMTPFAPAAFQVPRGHFAESCGTTTNAKRALGKRRTACRSVSAKRQLPLVGCPFSPFMRGGSVLQ